MRYALTKGLCIKYCAYIFSLLLDTFLDFPEVLCCKYCRMNFIRKDLDHSGFLPFYYATSGWAQPLEREFGNARPDQ